jgi:hypothetical protein
MQRHNDLWILLGLALLSSVLARLPLLNLLVYPFQIFNTFIHELSHGLAAALTGGSFRRFEVYVNGEGVAWSAGGVRWIVASAGYIGSALFGGILLVITARGVAAEKIILGLGIGLGILCVLFVRNIFGVISGVVIAAALIGVATQLAPRWNVWLLLFLSVQMCLNALGSLWDLLQISSSFRQQNSDARIMQQATGVPAIVWALLWSTIALLILWQAVRLAYFRE